MRRRRVLAFAGLCLAVVGLGVGGRAVLCAPLEPGALRPAPGALGDGADPAHLERHVRFLAESIGPRGQRHPEAMREAAAYLARAFESHGARIERQPTGVGRPPFENVLGRFGPDTGVLRIVGAHYDSFRDTPGADDNASGVAGLLELARLLAAMERPPPIELVAFANEEPPHFRTPEMGSVRHAASVDGDAEVVVLEMIGFFSDEPGSQDYPSAYLEGRMPDRGDFIAVIGRSADEAFVERVRDATSIREGLPVYGHAASASRPGVDFSDHRSYWPRGVPAVMVTDTAFLRNDAYHTPEDTPDRLDYDRMAAVVDGVFAWLVEPR